MNKKRISLIVLSLVLLIIGIQACNTYYFRSNYKDANALLHQTESLATKLFLKAHLKNGDIIIFRDSWMVDSAQQYVSGNGIRYDFNRTQIEEGPIQLSIDSVAIFETNSKIHKSENARITALSILAGIDLTIGMICITNPKACFGSCPTFYLNPEDNFHYADAEGFSNAITPSMEYSDIDALTIYSSKNNEFSITMKNEALETHCVRDVQVWAYPIQGNERVYHTRNHTFYLCENLYPIKRAEGPEGDVSHLLKYADNKERFSLANEKDLKSKAEIILNFEVDEEDEDLGLVLHFRQTLMTTYFIYSAMGYMGDEVGDIFAKMETNVETKSKLEMGLKGELGDIDVFVWNEKENNWIKQGGFYETGPIAINKQFIPFQSSKDFKISKVKLAFNKGLWRLDYAALTKIKKEINPIQLKPKSIFNKGNLDSSALKKIQDPSQHLISMPGSEFQFNFLLPETDTKYELFLYSKGYYLEWMRESWIHDKDLWKLRQMIEQPQKYLKAEAKNYKEYEKTMEHEFWNSKIDTKNFSFYEN